MALAPANSSSQHEDRGSDSSHGSVVAQPLPAVLSAGFNQDYSCFAIGTQTGFRVYSSDPFGETFRREFAGAGITIVEMLFLSNIFALVGGKWSANKVMIWDDHQGRCIGELAFRSAVRAVRLRRDRIVVVLETKLYVYNFADLKLLHQIETLPNARALCALSSAPASCVLACPGQHRGQVRVELYSARKTRFLQAHDSEVAALALSADGELLATASAKGTLVRVFNTADGSKLHEVRRGAEQAEIYSIAFSANAHWLAVSSAKGTVHVFNLKQEPGSKAVSSSGKNTASGGRSSSLLGRSSSLLSIASTTAGSSLSLVKGVLPGYFSLERSFAQFRVPEETRTIVGFGPQKNTVVIVGANGSYYRCSFDEIHGGDMVQVQFERFMKQEKLEEETGASIDVKNLE